MILSTSGSADSWGWKGSLGAVTPTHAECDYYSLYHLLKLLINLESLTQATNAQINWDGKQSIYFPIKIN